MCPKLCLGESLQFFFSSLSRRAAHRLAAPNTAALARHQAPLGCAEAAPHRTLPARRAQHERDRRSFLLGRSQPHEARAGRRWAARRAAQAPGRVSMRRAASWRVRAGGGQPQAPWGYHGRAQASICRRDALPHSPRPAPTHARTPPLPPQQHAAPWAAAAGHGAPADNERCVDVPARGEEPLCRQKGGLRHVPGDHEGVQGAEVRWGGRAGVGGCAPMWESQLSCFRARLNRILGARPTWRCSGWRLQHDAFCTPGTLARMPLVFCSLLLACVARHLAPPLRLVLSRDTRAPLRNHSLESTPRASSCA